MSQPTYDCSRDSSLQKRGRGWQCRAILMAYMILAGLLFSHGLATYIHAEDSTTPDAGDPSATAADAERSTAQPEEDSRVGTFARTLSLTADRDIEVRLRSARSAFQIGNSTEGVRVLAELLTLPEDHLIESRSTYRDIRDEVTQILRTGSQDLRDQFRRATEVRATAELKDARESGNLFSLRQILAWYPLTPTAREAALLLTQLQFDHGDFAGAAQTARHWIESAPEPAAEAQLSEALIHLWQQAILATEGPTAAHGISAKFGFVAREPDYRVVPAFDNVSLPPEPVPTATASWRVEAPFSEASQDLLREIVQLLRRNGVQPQLSSRPLIVGDQLFFRSPSELIAVRSTDGSVQWRKPLTDAIFEDVENWRARPDDNLLQRLKFQLGHRLLRDSIHGRLSCDAERVYSIERAPDYLPPLKNNESPANDFEIRAPVPARTIVARLRTTGETLWKSHEVWGAENQGFYVFGPPSLHKSQLFALIQKSEQLVLVRIAPSTGKLEAEFILGESAAPMLDQRRLNQLAPIVWHGDQAICATGAGAIVAFDVLAGRMKWAFRHPRHDNPPNVRFLQVPTAHHTWRWFSDWQETQLLPVADRLVYATPESRMLRCLSVERGDLLWEVSAENSSRIVAVDHERVLVQADHRVLSYRMTDGTIEVQHHTSASIASASWDGTRCLLNLSDGREQVWIPSTNQVSLSRGSTTWGQILSPPGTLRPIHEGTISLLRNVTRLGAHPMTITTQGVWSGDAISSVPLTAQLPVIDWETAPASSQIQKLNEWIEAAPESERMERLRVAMAENVRGIDSSPQMSDEFERLLEEWPAGTQDQIELTWRLLQRSLRDGRPEDSVRHLLLLLQQDTTQWEVDVDVGSAELPAERLRTVRLDAAIRGTFHRLWQQSSDPQRQVIVAKLRQWAALPNAVAGQWAAPLQSLRFWNAPDPAPVPIDSLARLATTQFSLIQKAAGPSRAEAAAAVLQLAEFQLQRGDRQHAAALLTRLQKQWGDVQLPDGADQLRASSARDLSTWPDRKPVVTDAKPSSIDGDSFIPVPIRAERGSPFDRIDVLCPWLPQRNIKFVMEGKLGWDSALPASNRDLTREHSLRRGWAFGQFVVLQLGSELFCIGSQKVQGTGKPTKTKEQFLWPRYLSPSQTKEPQLFVDTLGTEDNRVPPEYRPVPQVVGFSRPATEMFDMYGRRRAWVGPVSAGITCFLQQGMLVCLETSTGQELWRRYDMPTGVRCFGDENVIGIVHDDNQQVDLLSPFDGQTLRSDRWEPAGEVLHHWGRHLLIASGQPRAGMLLTPRPAGAVVAPVPMPQESDQEQPVDPTAPPAPAAELLEAPAQPLQLSLVDLSGMKTVWTRAYPAGSAAFEVDEEWLGVLHAPEKIELLDWRTGELVSETPVARPAGLIAVSAALSDQMIYVSLSSATTAPQLTTGYRTGWRWPLTNGPVYALDRQTGKQLWTREIENRGMPLSQPRDVPLMVFCDTWKGPHPERNADPRRLDGSWSRYLFLDARSGETLHESVIRQGSLQTPHYATMDKDRKTGRVDVKLDRMKIRFDYAPKSE